MSPNSLRMGMPSTPNISQTANIRVKATVEMTRTRTLPGSSVAAGGGAGATAAVAMILDPFRW